MAHAARVLYRDLAWIVSQLDKGRARGLADAEAWAALEIHEHRPTRSSIPPVAGVQQAVRVVAERTVQESKRISLGLRLGGIALRFVRDELRADSAARQATQARADGATVDTIVLRGETARARTEKAKWALAYNVLAENADVYPRADSRSGLRGELRSMYEALSRPRAIRD